MTPSCGITILRAHNERRLAKRFALASNGVVRKIDYDSPTWFTAETRAVAGIHDLHAVLQDIEADPHACVIRGALRDGVAPDRVRRRKKGDGAPFEEVARQWVMLDIDSTVALPAATSLLDDPDAVARYLLDILAAHVPELEDVSAVVQFSSSAALAELAEAEAAAGLPPRWQGVAKPGLSAHVWYWLAEPQDETTLKRWLSGISATGLVIDQAAARTVQPHYVAAPIFDHPLHDPLAGRRTLFVEGLADAASLRIPEAQAWAPAANGGGAGTANGGRGYRAFLAQIGGPDGFRAPMLRAVSSFVATNWPHVDTEALETELRAHILAADPGPRTQGIIATYASHDHLADLIRWVMEAEGEKRAQQQTEAAKPVAPAFADRGVSLEEGQRLAAAALDDFKGKLLGGEHPDLLLRVTTGGGKSETAIVGIAELGDVARAVGRRGVVYYAVPRHDLGNELLERLQRAHPGLSFAIWRGMDQPDPDNPGELMCRDRQLSGAAQAASQSAIAGCGVCEFAATCSYFQQRGRPRDVWVIPHNLLFQGKPSGLPEAAVVVVDEGFTSAAMGGMDARNPVQLAVSSLTDHRTGSLTGLDRDRLLFLRHRAAMALEQQTDDGGILREPFMDLGFAVEALGHVMPDAAAEWLELEWATKPKVKIRAGMDREAALAAFEAAAEQGFTPLRPSLARHVRDMLKDGAARSVNATLMHGVSLGRDQGTGDAVRFQWREPFAAWVTEAPKLFLDATTHADVVRCWAPDLQVVDIEIAAPHQHVQQIVGKQFGRATFTENPNNVRRLADIVVCKMAATNGAVLVVAQMAVEDLLRTELERRFGELPARLHLTHYGAVTGMDLWRDVDCIVCVGRPATNRLAGERLAEILKGGPVDVVADGEATHWPTIEAGIRLRDGTGRTVPQPCHPDPLVEAVRWSITEGSVLQAIGRGRGVRRTEEQPVHVTFLGELALPLTVDEVVDWTDAQPDRLTVAAAEAAIVGRALPLAPADLCLVRRDLWASVRAAELMLERAKTPHLLISDHYKGLRGFTGLTLAEYRRPAARRWSKALVPTTNGKEALTAELGELGGFRLVPDAPAAEPAAPTPTTPSAPPVPQTITSTEKKMHPPADAGLAPADLFPIAAPPAPDVIDGIWTVHTPRGPVEITSTTPAPMPRVRPIRFAMVAGGGLETSGVAWLA